MGIYIGLDIIPEKINKEEWKNMYNETLQLIKAYPFSCLTQEDVNGFTRIVLNDVDVIFAEEEGFWKVNGDLESKETGESFVLYSDLDRYNHLEINNEVEDILLSFNNESKRGVEEVFYSKTQGLPYHVLLLAIAALIESRFPRYACVYGNITQSQAQKAVEWVNSILDKDIDLPVRLNANGLLKRLEDIDGEEKQIEALYDLSIDNDKEVDNLIKTNFSISAIHTYFKKQLQEFKKPTQLGAELIFIRYLNAGLPFENLIDICHLDQGGSNGFDTRDFVKAVCSTWVFVEPQIRESMHGIDNIVGTSETVEEQFGSAILDMGFIGRRTRRYIKKEEVIKIFTEKLVDSEKLEEIIETEYRDIVKILEKAKYEREKLINETKSEKKENYIYNFDQLMFLNEKDEINKVIIKSLIELREEVDKSIATNRDLQQIIKEAEIQGRLIEVVNQLVQNQHKLVLTRPAWEWIENESNEVIKRMIVVLVLTVESTGELRKLFKALLENKRLYEKYIK